MCLLKRYSEHARQLQGHPSSPSSLGSLSSFSDFTAHSSNEPQRSRTGGFSAVASLYSSSKEWFQEQCTLCCSQPSFPSSNLVCASWALLSVLRLPAWAWALCNTDHCAYLHGCRALLSLPSHPCWPTVGLQCSRQRRAGRGGWTRGPDRCAKILWRQALHLFCRAGGTLKYFVVSAL